MILTCEEMRRAEEAAFSRGILAEDLMETAGRGLADLVRSFHPHPGTCLAVCGKGNNAGDALVALRHLQAAGWRIAVHLAYAPEEFLELPARHFQTLSAEEFSGVSASGPFVVLDGLLGLGAQGEPREQVAEAIRLINHLHRSAGAWVLAIDLPSGLDGDRGLPASCCVEADLTAAIAAVKQGLVADPATKVVGRLAVIPLPELSLSGASPDQVAVPGTLRSWLPPRPFEMHKGQAGRVGVVAGSIGFLGAANLCSAAAVRAGGGLVTLFAKSEVAGMLAQVCRPEVMVKSVASYREVLEENLDVLAVGPGLGFAHETEILALLRDAVQPLVIDADALTMVARDPALLGHCRGPRLLTPHPGEMARLSPDNTRTRRAWLEDFVTRHPVTLLLKGARTVIGTKGACFYNSTGNPGMASGGMGDGLTGVCAALAAQMPDQDRLLRAAVLGAWLCGRAAERAVFSPGGSPESLCASDVVSRLGDAFDDLRRGGVKRSMVVRRCYSKGFQSSLVLGD